MNGTMNRVKTRVAAYGFVTPAVITLALLLLYPFCYGIYISFFKTNLVNKWNFIGLKNYAKVLTEADFYSSMKITLIDGSFHPVDSDALSFEICARNGFREAARKASPVILEPIMKVEVVTPEENMGDIIGDLNKRRGQIAGMESRGNARVVDAKVPLSEMFGYVTVLRTISSGRATSSMEFSHFEEVPANLAKEIIEKTNGKKE